MAKIRIQWSETVEATYSHVFDTDDLEQVGVEIDEVGTGEVYGLLDSELAQAQEEAEVMYSATVNREIESAEQV